MWNIFNKTLKLGLFYLFIACVLKHYMVYILTRSLEHSEEKVISGNIIHWKYALRFPSRYNINDSIPAF